MIGFASGGNKIPWGDSTHRVLSESCHELAPFSHSFTFHPLACRLLGGG